MSYEQAIKIGNIMQKTQYRTSSNLDARINLHKRFSTNPNDWHQWVFDQIQLTNNYRIIELGCEAGYLWENKWNKIPNIDLLILTDLSNGMISETRKRTGSMVKQITFSIVNAVNIPFPKDSFDTVIANHMLYHVPDRDLAFSEIHRVLKPGGTLYASTNGQSHLRELFDLVQLSSPELSKQISESFSVSDFSLENGSAQLKSWFDSVRILQYPDALEVTEPEPLLAYILSMANSLDTLQSNSKPQNIEKIIIQKIKQSGSIHITKSSGLFIAQKPMHVID